MDLEFAAATDVGRQRNHNEDNFLIDKKLQLFVVADGMGGHAAGEVASSITVHELRDAVHANRDLLERFAAGDPEFQSVEILQMLEHAVQSACGAVYERAQAEKEKRGMGTTASVLLIVEGPTEARGFIAHVGDSRIYLTRQNQTHQLTEDHSLMNELVKRGKVKPGEIDASPYKQFKNAVTRAVGVYASVEVDTFDFDILPGDQFLMCSDGMYVYFEEEELPELLSTGGVDAVPSRLIDRANDGGGHDNITVVVIRAGDDAREDQRAADLSLKLEVLKGMPLFRYLSYKELVRVMNVTDTAEFQEGESLFREGEPGESMFVVLDGSLSLRKGDMTITTLGKGQHVGEMALVDRSPRSLSAVAASELRAVVMRRKDFYEIIKKEPGLSVKLLWSFVQVLAERLRKTTADLEGARSTAESARFEQVSGLAAMATAAEAAARSAGALGADAPTERQQRIAAPARPLGPPTPDESDDGDDRDDVELAIQRADSDGEPEIQIERPATDDEPEIEIQRADSDDEPEIQIERPDTDGDGDANAADDEPSGPVRVPADRGSGRARAVNAGAASGPRRREPRDTTRDTVRSPSSLPPRPPPRPTPRPTPRPPAPPAAAAPPAPPAAAAPPAPPPASERSGKVRATRPPPTPPAARAAPPPGPTPKGAAAPPVRPLGKSGAAGASAPRGKAEATVGGDASAASSGAESRSDAPDET